MDRGKIKIQQNKLSIRKSGFLSFYHRINRKNILISKTSTIWKPLMKLPAAEQRGISMELFIVSHQGAGNKTYEIPLYARDQFG